MEIEQEIKNKQENVRDVLRENTELINNIKILAEDNFNTIAKNVNIQETNQCKEVPVERNILEEGISQNITLEKIIKILEETRKKLIG